MSKNNPDLFSGREAADFLGVDERTLRRWRNEEINGVKVFEPKVTDHKGNQFYTREQLEQLKSVYDDRRASNQQCRSKAALNEQDVSQMRHSQDNASRGTFKPFSQPFLESLKDRSTEIADRLLRHSSDGKIVCPFCGNGSGDDGTGVEFNGQVSHCFKCGKGFNIFQAIMQEKSVAFAEAVKLCADSLGIALEYEDKNGDHVVKVYDSSKKDYSNARSENVIVTKPVEKKTADKSKAVAINMLDYYDKCNEALFKSQKAINYLTSRGLFDDDLIKTYKLGYDADINCIVVPHDDFYCTRRTITDDKKLRFIHNLKGVSVALFNAACIDSSEVVFVVEGAMDALSIIKAGGQAVAIGGATNVKLLVEALKKSDNTPAIVILTDDDKAGKTAAEAISKELKALKIIYSKVNLPEQLDANAWLVKDAKKLKKFVSETAAVAAIRNSFDRTPRGIVRATADNFDLIFRNDPKIKGCVGYNDFTDSIIRRRHDLPWDLRGFAKPTWTDSDDKALQNYIERTYEYLRNNAVYLSAFDEYAHKLAFHPVRDYLNNLPKWDATPRVEKVFIDTLGVEDTPYARAVSKKWLLAAVCRVFFPSCKFDYCLVFKGAQGIGKSTVASKLAANWFSDSITDISNKDAVEGLLGNWIIELGEMQATRKADNEAIKSFLSRTKDKVRLPYSRRSQEFPRQCVFCATTNNQEFLKDRTGGRRFWILTCNATPHTTAERLNRLDSNYIKQLWAEVMVMLADLVPNWQDIIGIPEEFDASILDLPVEIKKVAAELQAKHTEGSELTGMVEKFCDRPVPFGAYWVRLSLQARRKFFEDGYTFINREELVRLKNLNNLPASIKERVNNDFLHLGSGSELRLEPEQVRQKICAAEIANELLKVDNPAKDRRTIAEINEIMSQLPGWQQAPGVIGNFNIYGRQKITFYRKE